MSNKSDGTSFEKEFADLLSGYGFWAHRLQDNRNGQPFDLIAVKDGETCIFDCKVCQNDAFSLDRVEENQKLAMQLWSECGNREGLFALKLPSGIRILPYTGAMELIDSGCKRLAGWQMFKNTISFEEWIKVYEDYDK